MINVAPSAIAFQRTSIEFFMPRARIFEMFQSRTRMFFVKRSPTLSIIYRRPCRRIKCVRPLVLLRGSSPRRKAFDINARTDFRDNSSAISSHEHDVAINYFRNIPIPLLGCCPAAGNHLERAAFTDQSRQTLRAARTHRPTLFRRAQIVVLVEARMSHASANSNPPPIAIPFSAAINATADAVMRRRQKDKAILVRYDLSNCMPRRHLRRSRQNAGAVAANEDTRHPLVKTTEQISRRHLRGPIVLLTVLS